MTAPPVCDGRNWPDKNAKQKTRRWAGLLPKDASSYLSEK
jgi:hypothetical protein